MKQLFGFLFIALFFAFYTDLMAVPANPHPVILKQPNGDEITVVIYGDENVRSILSADGYTLMYDKNGFLVYAVTDSNGDLIPSTLIAKDRQFRSNELNETINNIPKGLHYSQKQLEAMRGIKKIERNIFANHKNENLRNAETTNLKAICVLVQFPDKKFKIAKEAFEALFNQVGYNAYGASGSVKDFFSEISYNQLNIDVTVVGPITLSKNSDYYGANDPSGVEYYSRLMEFAKESADQVFSTLNPVDYAMDIDGYKFIPAFHIIFAGFGEESSYIANEIWSHSTTVSPASFYNNIAFDAYSTTAELKNHSPDSIITPIGRICHEMTHVLGAPDYYDANGSADGNFPGTGKWDLMADGAWNNDGNTPAHPNMFQKIDFGWVIPEVLSAPTTIANLPNAAQNSQAYKIETATSSEYFVLENRQKIGFDSYIPHHGLMIYRVSITDADFYYNTVNCKHPQKVYPVCASATVDIPNNSPSSYGNVNDAGCPFPGSSGKTSFTDNTIPSAKTLSGVSNYKPISEITETGDLISFKFMLDTELKNPFSSLMPVYPNPAPKGSFVNIDADSGAEITIFDISGKIKKTVTSKGNATSVPTGWDSGTYIIQTTINGQIVQKKIIVK
jgi:M6 family metalloprotease-like protein